MVLDLIVYYALCNDVSLDKGDSITGKEIVFVPRELESARKGPLNCFCHTMKENVPILLS